MADQKIQMPGVFGGLMKYDAEYLSRFMISPSTIVIFVVLVMVFVIALKIFFPVVGGAVSSGLGHGGFVWPILGGVF